MGRCCGCNDVMWRYSNKTPLSDVIIFLHQIVFLIVQLYRLEKLCGVFRCDNKAVQMNIFAGFSKDGIHWDINRPTYPVQGRQYRDDRVGI